LHEKKPEKALEMVSEAAKSMPRMVEVLLVRAGALLDMGQPGRALVCVEAAIDLDPNNGDIAVERCRVLLELGEFSTVLTELKELSETYGRDPEVLHLLATAHEMLGNHQQADRLFTDAAELDSLSFPTPARISIGDLKNTAEQVLSTLPEKLNRHVVGARIRIMPVPPKSLIEGQDSPFPATVLGVCMASVARDFPPENSQKNSTGVQVVLFQRNLERASRTRSDLEYHVRNTIVNELSHYMGLHPDAPTPISGA
jgi:tetratricopeptide (TPR) repeat protein